ncbi:Esc2p NDAI_0B05600 [Naumovozyma dairenensis CBS 421]|uniref:Rad60/SUMO-like domain-containing protein n=1 Tax=Naumovozyma dairenensis (strain ATCC 10597 / BCRC 20456 / CBS 421 / NBRC 0211 / NRRL Y-12639) TaxID=1071378 RepID=G0W732_NAUDC|nr:hypothetical protein NDAI_0B05600 [Naumovozyma dairenensis CBS 421]CCD23593.1 hypothetical protein NDAI_0B05600 [Naumovozyma dairenensis CBS 421]
MSDDSSSDDFFMADDTDDELDVSQRARTVLLGSPNEIPDLKSDSHSDIKKDTPAAISNDKEDTKNNKSKNADQYSPVRTSSRIARKLRSPLKEAVVSADPISLDDDNNKRARSPSRPNPYSNSPERRSLSSSRSRSRSSSLSSTRSFSPIRKTPKLSSTLQMEPDENDEFFKEIAKEAKKIPSLTKESTPDKLPKRIYNIRFISKLDGTMNKCVQVKVLGKFQFQKILPAALTGLIKAYSIPSVLQKYYSVDNVSLYWNHAKLLDFMTCNSLNIPQAFENEVTNVDIELISKDDEIENEKAITEKLLKDEREVSLKLEAAKKEKEIQEKLAKELAKEEKENEVFEEFEHELENVSELKTNGYDADASTVNEANELALEEGNADVMKIALVGQDNKKIHVNVRGTTPFSKVAEYYRIQKQLPQNAKIKLVFDHEELSLYETIEDQDMEDDDMIEVVIS